MSPIRVAIFLMEAGSASFGVGMEGKIPREAGRAGPR